MSSVLGPAPEKARRIRRFLDKHQLDAVILATPSNFAWITDGAPQERLQREDAGAALLVSRDRAATPDSTGALLLLPGLPRAHWSPVRGRLAADVPLADTQPLSRDFDSLHAPLLPNEIERYRHLGEDLSVCVTWAAFHLRPGLLRSVVRGMLIGQMVAMEIEPTRVAADLDGNDGLDPGVRLTETVQLSVVGQRRGLHAAMTRVVCFLPPNERLLAHHHAAQQGAAIVAAEARPGLRIADDLIAAAGHQRDAPLDQVRHSGGPIGYLFPTAKNLNWLEEVLQLSRRGDGAPPAVPARARSAALRSGQAFAWRTSLGPTACEDTYLLTEAGVELLTATPDLPADAIEVDGVRTLQPGLLVR